MGQNPATTVGVLVGVFYGGEAALIAQSNFVGKVGLAVFAAGVVGCWLIYRTARRTRSKAVTALVGIGLMALIPIVLFLVFAATYPADNS